MVTSSIPGVSLGTTAARCSTETREYRTATRTEERPAAQVSRPRLEAPALSRCSGGCRLKSALLSLASVLPTARFGGKPQYRPKRRSDCI